MVPLFAKPLARENQTFRVLSGAPGRPGLSGPILLSPASGGTALCKIIGGDANAHSHDTPNFAGSSGSSRCIRCPYSSAYIVVLKR